MGMAKFTFCAPSPETDIVLTPATQPPPLQRISGPPLLPGLMGAEVRSIRIPGAIWSKRLMMPSLTLIPAGNAFPMATHFSPTITSPCKMQGTSKGSNPGVSTSSSAKSTPSPRRATHVTPTHSSPSRRMEQAHPWFIHGDGSTTCQLNTINPCSPSVTSSRPDPDLPFQTSFNHRNPANCVQRVLTSAVTASAPRIHHRNPTASNAASGMIALPS